MNDLVSNVKRKGSVFGEQSHTTRGHGGREVSGVEALQLLVASVIQVAVEDYKICEKRGLISHGEVVKNSFEQYWEGESYGGRSSANSRMGIHHALDVPGLLLFLKRDMDFLIDLACLNVDAGAVREKLGITRSIHKKANQAPPGEVRDVEPLPEPEPVEESPAIDPREPLAGEVSLKSWIWAEASRLGCTTKTIYSRWSRGNYDGLNVRRVNERIIFVRTES